MSGCGGRWSCGDGWLTVRKVYMDIPHGSHTHAQNCRQEAPAGTARGRVSCRYRCYRPSGCGRSAASNTPIKRSALALNRACAGSRTGADLQASGSYHAAPPRLERCASYHRTVGSFQLAAKNDATPRQWQRHVAPGVRPMTGLQRLERGCDSRLAGIAGACRVFFSARSQKKLPRVGLTNNWSESLLPKAGVWASGPNAPCRVLGRPCR